MEVQCPKRIWISISIIYIPFISEHRKDNPLHTALMMSTTCKEQIESLTLNDGKHDRRFIDFFPPCFYRDYMVYSRTMALARIGAVGAAESTYS